MFGWRSQPADRRSNAPQIDPGRVCVAKKCACEYCMTARAGPGAGPAGTRACLTSMSPVWGMYMSRGMHQCIYLSDCFRSGTRVGVFLC